MAIIERITTYMKKGERTIRVSTVRGPGEPYETMVFEDREGTPVQDRGGDYCKRGEFATSIHSAVVNRFWDKGFRTLRTDYSLV